MKRFGTIGFGLVLLLLTIGAIGAQAAANQKQIIATRSTTYIRAIGTGNSAQICNLVGPAAKVKIETKSMNCVKVLNKYYSKIPKAYRNKLKNTYGKVAIKPSQVKISGNNATVQYAIKLGDIKTTPTLLKMQKINGIWYMAN
jgi:hypothetical protein